MEKVTAKTVKVRALKDYVDYIIDTYTKDKTDFFDKLSAAQSALKSICVYSGAYILGTLQKSEEFSNYLISTSPYVDQEFYIQDPYYRSSLDSQNMLMSALYPYALDSVFFPGMMADIAKRIDPSVTVENSSIAHYLVDVTKDEALSMNLDRNTNKEPSEFLIYDGYSEPGTKGNN